MHAVFETSRHAVCVVWLRHSSAGTVRVDVAPFASTELNVHSPTVPLLQKPS